MIENIIQILFKSMRRIFPKAKYSFSQAGEDLILDVIFKGKSHGFYVDVGANNPFVQSNTCLFYLKGWKGINIDALPGSMNQFNKFRKRDINLELAISDEVESLIYYKFESSFYNTFDVSSMENILKNTALKKKILITMVPLQDVLEQYLTTDIDVMSIDVEGFDLKVLKSNNWLKFRPKVILVEKSSYSARTFEDESLKFLKEKSYSFFCSTPTNAIFLEDEYWKLRFPEKG